MNNEFSRNWYEISSQDYLFDRREKEIKVYETLEKAAMIEIMSNLLSKNNQNYKKISLQVVGSEIVDDSVLEDKPDEAVYELQYHSSNDKSFITDV